MKLFAVVLVSLVLSNAVHAAAPVEVLILGTYHMGNPGLDLHNSKADDVLAPSRQRQLEAVVDDLARFKPTRIAVEWKADDLPMHNLPAYHDFLDGKREGSRNEIDQIAFRLARKMKLAEVQGIDAEGDFPYEELQAYAAKSGRSKALQSATALIESNVRSFDERQATSSVGELLRSMNDAQSIRDDQAFYMRMLSFGSGSEQPGADLAGQWAIRNLRICARLAQIAKPGDRVVVVYGAGHNHLLRQCVIDMPDWKLVETNDFLPH